MTARDLLALVLRRWYFMVLGAGLTMAVAYVATHQAGIYWTQFNVVLLAPQEQTYSNRVEDPHYSLAPMAGVVAAKWNGTEHSTITASGATTMFGLGRTSGTQVRIPNQGNQWRPGYFSPNIDVQVAGPDPGIVHDQAQRVVAELDEILLKEQDAVGVPPSMRISTITSPSEPTVYYISGNRPRALGAIGLAGAIGTTVAVVWLDRWLKDRRSRRLLRAIGAESTQEEWVGPFTGAPDSE